MSSTFSLVIVIEETPYERTYRLNKLLSLGNGSNFFISLPNSGIPWSWAFCSTYLIFKNKIETSSPTVSFPRTKTSDFKSMQSSKFWFPEINNNRP